VTIRDGQVDIALPNVNGVGLRRNPEPEITLRSASLLWRR
jgi:hypothetical protein